MLNGAWNRNFLSLTSILRQAHFEVSANPNLHIPDLRERNGLLGCDQKFRDFNTEIFAIVGAQHHLQTNQAVKVVILDSNITLFKPGFEERHSLSLFLKSNLHQLELQLREKAKDDFHGGHGYAELEEQSMGSWVTRSTLSLRYKRQAIRDKIWD